MSEELAKLHDLFKNGFIMKEEYESRKYQIVTNKKPANEASSYQVLSPEEIASEIATIRQLVATMDYGNNEECLLAVTTLREILSSGRNIPIEAVINSGGISVLVRLLDYLNEEIQYQAAWALTNIASGSSQATDSVIKGGAVPLLINLLKSNSYTLQEQATWALGNICGDSAVHRDFLVAHNALQILVDVIQQAPIKRSFIRTGIWAVSNFCRGVPSLPFFHLAPAIPLIARVLSLADEEAIADACWSLTYITDGPLEAISAVVEAGLDRKLIANLSHSSLSVVTPALRTLGNIASGDDAHVALLLSHDLLPRIPHLLDHPKMTVRKEACWMVSNITAGNKDHIQAVIEANLIPPMISLMKHENCEVKKESMWVVLNASNGSVPQIEYLIDQGCVPPMVDMLKRPENDLKQWEVMLPPVLEGLKNLCERGAQISAVEHKPNPALHEIERAGGLPSITDLLSHNHATVRATASTIMGYFST